MPDADTVIASARACADGDMPLDTLHDDVCVVLPDSQDDIIFDIALVMYDWGAGEVDETRTRERLYELVAKYDDPDEGALDG